MSAPTDRVQPGDALGWIGLGRMGMPMSRRLADAGFPVRGFDLDPGVLREFTRATPGCSAATGPADCAKQARAVVLMLPSSAAVEQVMRGGLLERLSPGTIVVDMGSSDPTATRALADLVVQRGASFVDAPVSGGVAGARTGSLTIMSGGNAEDLARLDAVLSRLGSRVLHVGPVGAGHALKAINNLLSATHLLASVEALEVALRFGLDAEVVLDAINTSSGRSGSTERKLPDFVLAGSYDSGFSLALMLKDMRTATTVARSVGAPAALGEAAVGLWDQAAQALPADADHTEIARWVQERATR